ncbi:MAG: prolipoprotein diacylglyceryl transferase [Myxococcota bacterium]|nr:prolipoprotein diacylglyceryl transferase [Myxococcota bacterium]
MRPWLLRLDLPLVGEVALQSYFFWLMMGCLVASEVAIREARRSKESPLEILKLSAAAIVVGLLGARSFHFLFVAPDGLAADPTAFFRVWEGGMVFYGGFLGGLGTLLVWCRLRGLPVLRVGDILAAPAMMGLALGRIGCLSNGCCYGRPIDWGTGIEWPWAVTFLNGQLPSALKGIPLHPTQAYAVINAVAIFLLLGWLRRRQRFEGQVLGVLFVVYGITRSILELFRLDLVRNFLFEEQWGQVLSTSQAISIPVVLLGAWLLCSGSRSRGSWKKSGAQ